MCDHKHAPIVVGLGEIDLEVPRRQDRHPADNHVKLLSQQGRDDVGPVRPHKLDRDPHIFRDLGRHINLKADQLPLGVAGGPRLEQPQADP